MAIADRENDSSQFIEFMLDIILETLIAYKKSDKVSDKIHEDLSITEDAVDKIFE